MPLEISDTESSSGVSSKFVLVLILLFLIVGAVFITKSEWQSLLGNLLPTSYGSVENSSATPIFTQSSGTSTIPAASMTETVSPTSIATPVLTPIDTVIPLSNPHRYEVIKTPQGSDQGFLVHVIVEGEALEMIADHYNTTVQAIRTVNFKLKPPIWARSPIVIPVGADNATGLPALEVYVVGDAYEEITAEALADILGVDAAKLEFYNLCIDNCQFHKGDVLLVPAAS